MKCRIKGYESITCVGDKYLYNFSQKSVSVRVLTALVTTVKCLKIIALDSLFQFWEQVKRSHGDKAEE
jgi:hypothetical protein